jgi:nucleoside-diphosphate-sugar epimerase
LRNAAAGCDTIFHLAGRVRANSYREFEETNVIGTENLARVGAEVGVQTFVHVSSLAAAGISTPDQPKIETDEPKPISNYGKTKLAGEQALKQLAGSMQCTIIRPSIVFGEADRMNLELFKTVKRWGLCPNPGFTYKQYSWIHAADLSDLLVLAAKKGERLAADGDAGTGIYFAAYDSGRYLSEIALLVRHALGKKRIIPILTPPIAVWTISTFYEAVKLCTHQSVAFDWAKAYESLHHWTCSPEKAMCQLGFLPKSLEARMFQTIHWYLDKGWLY